MVQLMQKDLRLFAKPLHIFVILILDFLCVAVIHAVSFGATLTAFFFVTTIVSYDDKNKSTPLLNSLPVRREDLVTIHYVEGIGMALVGYILSFIMKFPVALMSTYDLTTFSFTDFVQHLSFSPASLFIGIGAALLILGIFYPVHFKFGMVGTYVVTPVIFAFALMYILFLSEAHGFEETGVFGLVFLACILWYVLSYFLAIQLYKRKDV